MDGWREDADLYGMEPGMDVSRETGLLESADGCAVNFIPYPAEAGTKIIPRPGVRCRLYRYAPAIPPELIHTYCYQPEANWTAFLPERSEREWSDRERTAEARTYLRIAVRGAEGGTLTDYVRILPPPGEPEPAAPRLERLQARVRARRQEGDLALLLVSDTHYTTGCIWPDTLRSLRAAAALLSPDACVHLGDFTDGLLPAWYTRRIARHMLEELRELTGRLWCCVGNHDRNAFRGNRDRMTAKECARLYLGGRKRWYCVDLPDKRLRLLFLDSFDPEKKERYGFAAAEVLWLWRTLAATPKDTRILVFSHVPPAAGIHVWSRTIRNGERVLSMLERFHERRGGAVLGWIHGHNHADQIYGKRAFPVVGVGCGKLEDFTEHKPEGAVTPPRTQGGADQELWDFLLVHPSGGMDFLRFGAGEDRHTEMRRP